MSLLQQQTKPEPGAVAYSGEPEDGNLTYTDEKADFDAEIRKRWGLDTEKVVENEEFSEKSEKKGHF